MKNRLSHAALRHSSETIRLMIDRENDLINHRINWLMTIQGLLFASLSFSFDKLSSKGLISILCILGIAISIVILVSLIGATRSQSRLWDWWVDNRPRNYSGPDVMGLPLDKRRLLRYTAVWNWVPLIFIAAWAVVWYIFIGI